MPKGPQTPKEWLTLLQREYAEINEKHPIRGTEKRVQAVLALEDYYARTWRRFEPYLWNIYELNRLLHSIRNELENAPPVIINAEYSDY